MNLKKCPLCGSKQIFVAPASGKNHVLCLRCGNTGPNSRFKFIAAYKWNRKKRNDIRKNHLFGKEW